MRIMDVSWAHVYANDPNHLHDYALEDVRPLPIDDLSSILFHNYLSFLLPYKK